MPAKKKDAGASKYDLIKERDGLVEHSKELAAASEAQGVVVADLGRGKAAMVMRVVELEVALSELQRRNRQEKASREAALTARRLSVAQAQETKDALAEDAARTLAAGHDVREEVHH